MPDERDFEVLRQHEGDQVYKAGDTRKARPDDVAHLVRMGVLKEKGGAKREDPPQNKAEPGAPQNKAEPILNNKSGRSGRI